MGLRSHHLGLSLREPAKLCVTVPRDLVDLAEAIEVMDRLPYMLDGAIFSPKISNCRPLKNSVKFVVTNHRQLTHHKESGTTFAFN